MDLVDAARHQIHLVGNFLEGLAVDVAHAQDAAFGTGQGTDGAFDLIEGLLVAHNHLGQAVLKGLHRFDGLLDAAAQVTALHRDGGERLLQRGGTVPGGQDPAAQHFLLVQTVLIPAQPVNPFLVLHGVPPCKNGKAGISAGRDPYTGRRRALDPCP